MPKSKDERESQAKSNLMGRLKRHYEKTGQEKSGEQLHREVSTIQEKVHKEQTR